MSGPASVPGGACGSCSTIPHVVPLRVLQTEKIGRWNCNVFRCTQKMTALNYVRHLSETVFATANGHQGQAQPPPSGTAADPSGVLHTYGAWCAHGVSTSPRSIAWPQRLNPRRPVVLRWRQALINRVRSFHSSINLVHLQHCTT